MNANNDLRLGANEAPPAILSVFVGDQLTDIIEKTIAGLKGRTRSASCSGRVASPVASRDNTDRNRTSPLPSPGTSSYRAVGKLW